ncbi:MAG: hypothetical protein ACI9IJ_002311, partial [Psychromonas sp.]
LLVRFSPPMFAATVLPSCQLTIPKEAPFIS